MGGDKREGCNETGQEMEGEREKVTGEECGEVCVRERERERERESERRRVWGYSLHW